ncbi:MAG: ABC transporter substrate-binding protein, partial [Thermodesulfovibrionales bacterium]
MNPDLVAVFCGKFSPSTLEALPVIHKIGIPLLDPWAAADAITDNKYTPNFAFRLSLKDSWAIPVMMRHAAKKGIHKVGLLAPRTSWGRSNVEAANRYVLSNPAMKLVTIQWYNWGESSLIAPYQSIRNAGAGAVLLIANEGEGSILVREVAHLEKGERLPLISQWGITGGDFPALTQGALRHVDLSVVQTFTFMGRNDPKTEYVLQAAKRLFHIERREDIKSPVGLAHAYDLTHILAKAIDAAGSADRRKIRDALEKLDRYDGLVKSYKYPFTATRHDALSPGDVFMARYDENGVLVKAKK